MKKLSFGMVALCMLHAPMFAEQATVTMPQFGKQVVRVGANDTLTYLDYQGYGSMAATASNSAYATTIFVPAQDGYTIYIDFDTVHVSQIADNAPTCLKIYQGVFDTLSVTYPTDYKGVTTTVFPHTAAQLDSLTITQTYGGLFRHKTYLSKDATGALSVCFSSCAKVVSFGWNARVYALPNHPQEVTLAVPDYSQVATSVYGGETNVSLGAFALQTDGAAPVDTLLSVQFTLTDKTVFTPAQIALYVGNAERTLLPTASNPYTNIRSKVETTFSEADGVYTLTMNQPLEFADNLFCLGSDVLVDAVWDALSTLTITGITTRRSGTVSVSSVTPVGQRILPTVTLEGGKQKVIDVNRDDIRFYDNGGIENKYNNAAEAGTVTFRPTTAGKRAMIEFESIAINSRDTLCVYSGTEINASHLLYTGQHNDKNIRVKSLSADGALTVRFATRLKDGSSSSYNGWEATLSEFVPKPMVITSSSVSKEKSTPVCGTKDVRVLHFVLNVEDTENALTPVSFSLNTGNTYKAMTHTKLYYTAGSSKFSTTNMIAEADITSDAFTLATTMGSLREGQHHFFVVADIANTAATDDVIDLNIVSVTMADNRVYNAFANPVSGVKVLNSVASVCDEHSYPISGTWQFTHTAAKASDYPTVAGGYALDMCDQITTFVPATTGAKIHIEFSLFDIYYANDAYGFDSSKAMFVVYNGSDTYGDVLFEVNSVETATTIPSAITSTAEDGTLTVLFNANPSYMGMTNAGGWKATVTESGNSSTSVKANPMADKVVVKYLTADGQLRIATPDATYNSAGQKIE